MKNQAIKAHEFRAIRLRLNMTQQQFGEALGYSEKGAGQRIWEIEHGIKPIVSVRLKLLRILERESQANPPRSVRLATRPEFQS